MDEKKMDEKKILGKGNPNIKIRNEIQPGIFTKYVRPDIPKETNSGELIVETKGVMTVQQQVERLINAGKNLENWKKNTYDFAPGEPDNGYNDPTRAPGFDRAEASELQRTLEDHESVRSANRIKKADEEADMEEEEVDEDNNDNTPDLAF